MKFILNILIILFIFPTIAEDLIIDTRGYYKNDEIVMPDGSKLLHYQSKGNWSDNFNNYGSNKYLEGTKEFLQSNSIVAKLAFLILVVFIFIILLRLGITILSYLFSFSPDPILLDGMVDGEQLIVRKQNPNFIDLCLNK